MAERSDNEAVLDGLHVRGERPLSLLDLIDRRTCDLELAAWFMDRVSGGASFIVGAGPGGVGKSTIMRALLGFVPGGVSFAVALPERIGQIDGVRTCVISHELSDHRVPGYLWDQDLRDFFALGAAGHVLVSNMHADDMDEARDQIAVACRVPDDHLRAVDLFAFVRREADSERRVFDAIHYSDGSADHRPVYLADGGLARGAHRHASGEARCRAFLEEALAAPERTVGDLRRRFLAWQG